MEAREMNTLTERAVGTQSIADTSYVQGLERKWNSLLTNVKNRHTRSTMAVLYENQSNHMAVLAEDTLSTNAGRFTKYVFPILRMTFPNLLAHQIVSVQPMNAAVGGIFTYDYVYSDTKGKIAAGTAAITNFNQWYSSELVDEESSWTGGGAGTHAAILGWLPIRPSAAANAETGITISATITGVAVTDIVDDGAGALTSASVPGLTGTINYTTGAVSLTAGGADTFDAVVVTAAYYYNSEMVGRTVGGRLPAMNLDIKLTPVEAKSRKLNARWSAEAADDLRSMHGIEAEAEIVKGISNEINLELDREIVDTLVINATHSATWSHAPGGWNASGAASELQSIRHLITMIDGVSAKIQKSTRRAPANFVVCSPEVGSLLAQLTTNGDFQPSVRPGQDASHGVMNSHFGTMIIGTLRNRYTVFQDPYMATNKVLVGYKGPSFLDAGFVFAPYIPVQVTQTFQDPDDQSFRKSIRTRYATKMVRPEMYGVITVTGIPTIL